MDEINMDVMANVADMLRESNTAEAVQAAKANLGESLEGGVDPVAASKRLERARNLGVDPSALDTLPAAEKFRPELDAVDWARMRNEAPRLLQMFQDRGTVDVVKGDVTSLWNLEGWKQLLSWKMGGDTEKTPDKAGVGNALARGTTLGFVNGPGGYISEIRSGRKEMREIEAKRARVEELLAEGRTTEADALFDNQEDPETARRLFMATTDERLSYLRDREAERIELLGYHQKRLAMASESAAGLEFAKAEGLGEAFRAYAENPSLVAEQGLQSLAMLAPQLASLFFTGPALGAAVMGGSSGSLEANSTYMEALSTRVDVGDGDALRAFLDDPANAAFLDRIGEEADKKGLVVGAFDAASVALAAPLEKVLNRLVPKTTLGSVGKAVTQIEAQGALGAAGEGLGQVAAYGKIDSARDILAEFVGEHFTGPVEVLGALHHARAEAAQEKAAADRNMQVLQAVAREVAALKNPDASVLKRLFDDESGDKSQTLHLDADALKQSSPELYDALAAVPELKERMSDAAAQGSPVDLTLGEYAAHVAPLDGGTGDIATHVAVGDHLAQSQAQAEIASAHEQLTKEAAEGLREAARAERRARQETLKEIRSEIRTELGKLEGVTEDEAAAVSTLWTSLVDVLATDLNMDARKVWEENGLKFDTQTLEAGDTTRGLYSDSLRTIFRTARSDRSTLLHESGHAYLEMRNRMLDHVYEKRAAGEELTAGEQHLLDTNDEILAWLGFDRDKWRTASMEEKRAAHEKFAESFEAYLRNGQAPVRGLRKVFAKFKAWLKQIYFGLSIGKHAEWNPEVQRLFNGIFLSRQLAEEFKAKNPSLFDTSFMNRDSAEADVTDKLVAVDDTHLVLEGMEEEIQAAYEKLVRRLRRRKKRSMRALRKQAREQYRASKTFKAIQALKGENAEAVITPTAEVLKALGYGEGHIRRLLDARMARVRPTAKTTNDVETLNAYAKALGYEAADGNHAVLMLDDALNHADYQAAVNQLAEQAWNANQREQEVENLLRDFSVEEAVFNEDLIEQTRGVLRKFERLSSAVEKASGQAVETAATAWVGVTPLKQHDLRTIARDMRRNARLAREAYMEGRVADAIAYQKKALYQAAVGRAVRQARKDAVKVGKIIRRLKKLENPKIGGRHLELIHRTLAAMGIGTLKKYHLNRSDKPLSAHLKELGFLFSPEFLRRLDNNEGVNILGRPRDYTVEPGEEAQAYYDENIIRHEDGSPLTPEEEAHNAKVLEETEALDEPRIIVDVLETDTADGIRDLGELLYALEQQGREALKIRKEKELVELQEAQAAIIADMQAQNARTGRGVRVEHEDNRFVSRLTSGLRTFFMQHLRIGTAFGRMVGRDSRALFDYVLKPTDQCATNEEVTKADLTKRLDEALSPVYDTFRSHEKADTPHNRGADGKPVLERSEVLVLLFNMGNEGNFTRAIVTYANRLGINLDEVPVEEVKASLVALVQETLTVEEVRSAQRVWDLFEGVQKETKEVTRRMDKKEPEWVEKAPLRLTVGGETVVLEGGYYPIRYDRLASRQNIAHDLNDIMEGVSVFAKHGICEGHLKSRIGAVPADMYLTLTERALYEGLDEQVHYNCWAEHLKKMTQLFDPSTELSKFIRDYWGKDAIDYTHEWLTDIANGNKMQGKDVGSTVARFLRHGVSVAGIGLNLVTALIQPIGYTQTVQHLGGKYALRGLAQYLRMGAVAAHKHVSALSPMMRMRAQTQFRELREIHAHCEGGASVARAAMMRAAYFPIIFTQMLVDVPTWLGAYEKAVERGFNQEDAVAYADRQVIETQGSGRENDLSRIERGGEWSKLFTVFYTFFNSTLNLLALSGYQKNKVGFMRDFLILCVLQPVIEGFLREGIKDLTGDGDDEKDRWYMRALKKSPETLTSFNLGLFVGLRELGDVIGENAYQGPGGTRVIGDMYRLSRHVPDILEGDVSPAALKAMVSVMGSTLGLPVVPVNRAISGYNAVNIEHTTDNWLAYVFGASTAR